MTKFDIEIVSDTVCPWCYVGKQKLDKAIKAYRELHPDSNDTFSTTWMPFYLNPGAPKTGIDKASYFKQKFGEDRTSMIFDRLAQTGKEVGINFKFGGKTGNTRDSHRLIQLGKSKSPAVQTRVVEELFSAYFENEGDITSHEVLLNAAKKAGLEEKEAKEWLASDKGGKEVDVEVEEAQMNQISGVPNFTIQGKYEIGGAQDPGVFLRLFEKIKATEEGAKA
ncbi:related to DSBA-like thioredoxin domain protein [Phialocephala subalpina]|jgi:predicted DsbA family dithiol-disulfide isomerase|uniref:Related to DSBA-like thioredoxin domain protein n=1 Tax=Phialocephala subalpina TaxID=576137 RepID=A0A1L7WWH7_9HELO|nr:related to DSBA-like thioredoxin domain protein [Phialocephala subalpina]